MALRFALLLLLAVRVHACSCGAGNLASVKQAWEKSRFVFLGTVEMAEPDGNGNDTMFREQSVRIRVDEAFKGVIAGQTIDLQEGADDCSAKFRVGERFVFYLYQLRTGRWVVPPCSHSLGNAAPAGDDLLFLRGLPKSAVATRLSGEVELYEDSAKEAFKRVGGVQNVIVKISGPAGATFEATTNEDGAYELYDLRPGRYSVGIEVPKGLRTAFPVVTGSLGNGSTVELEVGGGASVSFVLKADTRMSGRLMDVKNRPVKDVCIDLEPVEGRGENGARFFNCSKLDGTLQMEMMPPGEYWLVARDEVGTGRFKSKSTLYYPGTRDRDGAKSVAIEPGKYAEHFDLKIPSDERRYQFTGRIQYEDGAPARGRVTFTSPRHGYTETTETGRDGSFGLLVVAGVEGQLTGYMTVLGRIAELCSQFKVRQIRGLHRFLNTNPVSISSDSDRRDLKLVFPFRSCEAWPPPNKRRN